MITKDFRSFLGEKRSLPMKPHSISYYLKLTIKQVYDLLEVSLILYMKVTAYVIRGVCVTIAAFRHGTVKHIFGKDIGSHRLFSLITTTKFVEVHEESGCSC